MSTDDLDKVIQRAIDRAFDEMVKEYGPEKDWSEKVRDLCIEREKAAAWDAVGIFETAPGIRDAGEDHILIMRTSKSDN